MYIIIYSTRNNKWEALTTWIYENLDKATIVASKYQDIYDVEGPTTQVRVVKVTSL